MSCLVPHLFFLFVFIKYELESISSIWYYQFFFVISHMTDNWRITESFVQFSKIMMSSFLFVNVIIWFFLRKSNLLIVISSCLCRIIFSCSLRWKENGKNPHTDEENERNFLLFLPLLSVIYANRISCFLVFVFKPIHGINKSSTMNEEKFC
jgi:hypothetical protein